MNIKQLIELFKSKAEAVDSEITFYCDEIINMLSAIQNKYPLIVLEPPDVINEDISNCYEDYSIYLMVMDKWEQSDQDTLYEEWVKLKGYGDSLISAIRAYDRTQVFMVDKRIEIRYYKSEGNDNTPAVSYQFNIRVKI